MNFITKPSIAFLKNNKDINKGREHIACIARNSAGLLEYIMVFYNSKFLLFGLNMYK